MGLNVVQKAEGISANPVAEATWLAFSVTFPVAFSRAAGGMWWSNMIKTQGLVKRVPLAEGELEILKGIDFEIKARETVAIVGASGSGKSSLVAAGLIPRLRAGALPGGSQWVDVTFKPGERGGDPYLALAYALKAVLGTTGRREVELVEKLREVVDGVSFSAD